MKKSFKKILAGVLAVATLCLTTPINGTFTNPLTFKSAYTASAETYGDLTYRISRNEITISDCSETATEVVIPSEIDGLPVTSISITTFSYCTSLTSITIPESINSIDTFSFSYCTSLTSINVDENNPNYTDIDGVLYSKDKTAILVYPAGKTSTEFEIPDFVTTIAKDAFRSSNNLISVKIPYSVTTIEGWAFASCPDLTSITIPSTVTDIGDYAFSYCDSLLSITVDKNNEYYSDIDGVLLSKDKTTLIQYAGGKPLQEYEIPDVVTHIGETAFKGCSNLSSLIVPESVTNIIVASITSCPNLASIFVDENNEYYSDIDGVLLDKEKSTLFRYPEAKPITEYEVPNSVEIISEEAFSGCNKLSKIIIPDSVTTIEKAAFQFSTSLESITIPDSVTIIQDDTFFACGKLKSVIIPNSVTIIGEFAFTTCSSLSSITIPDSVTSIGKYAFSNCSSLTAITIPSSVETIESTSFDPNLLKTIYGYTGSYAETYANEKGITFIALDAELETGDLNGDGDVESADIVILKQAIYGSQKLSPNQAVAADINGDGKINVFDLTLLKRNITK